MPVKATTSTPAAELPNDGPTPTSKSLIALSVTRDRVPNTASCITCGDPSEMVIPSFSVAFALKGWRGVCPKLPGGAGGSMSSLRSLKKKCHKPSGGVVLGGPIFRPARLESGTGQELDCGNSFAFRTGS